MNATRAVLRDENGEHICVLTDAAQIERLERQCAAGDVIKSHKMKKGRLTVIFRLKAVVLEQKITPSDSRTDESDLSEIDCEKNAGCHGVITTREAERLMGRGIVTSRKLIGRGAHV